MSKKNNNQIKKAMDFDEYLALRIKNKKFRNDFENYGKRLGIAHKKALQKIASALGRNLVVDFAR